MLPDQKYDTYVDKQIAELQSKLAYQEDTVQSLNDMVAEQQQDIMHLQRQVCLLLDELKGVLSDLGDDNSPIVSEKPPHY